MRGESFFRMCIKLASARVPLDGSVELCGVEDFKPRAKPRQLARGKLFDGFLDVFGGGHVKDTRVPPIMENSIPPTARHELSTSTRVPRRDAEKGVERSHKTHAPSGT